MPQPVVLITFVGWREIFLVVYQVYYFLHYRRRHSVKDFLMVIGHRGPLNLDLEDVSNLATVRQASGQAALRTWLRIERRLHQLKADQEDAGVDHEMA